MSEHDPGFGHDSGDVDADMENGADPRVTDREADGLAVHEPLLRKDERGAEVEDDNPDALLGEPGYAKVISMGENGESKVAALPGKEVLKKRHVLRDKANEYVMTVISGLEPFEAKRESSKINRKKYFAGRAATAAERRYKQYSNLAEITPFGIGRTFFKRKAIVAKRRNKTSSAFLERYENEAENLGVRRQNIHDKRLETVLDASNNLIVKATLAMERKRRLKERMNGMKSRDASEKARRQEEIMKQPYIHDVGKVLYGLAAARTQKRMAEFKHTRDQRNGANAA